MQLKKQTLHNDSERVVIPWKDLHKVFTETNKYKLKSGSESKAQNHLQGFNRNTDILSESVKKKKRAKQRSVRNSLH